ncbi:DUF2059 domain-containing protein [Wenyingzhuangia sp. chi5]|uniref:DUF2059 domain-containing protein n=1 Tax=Wenyingzhuangia gilva TaxID=3057677 RepID=A0ABT8VV02_9FLAO|nr:DUF2059 domain-containing protein [Wenyingzhuangia sp. chi5]MDO3695811.1 DUF2059 domain-containing protein [Wenyingzhuangia sp. chi5]
MKKIFSLLMFLTLTVNAQAPKEKVLELIDVMQADKMISQMMDQMIPMMQQQMKSSLKTEEQEQKIEKVNTIVLEEAKNFTNNIVNGAMVDIYAKYFSENDINYMIGFYKSETGKKLLKLTPTISKELMEKMMQDEMSTFQQKIKERIAELEKIAE